MVWVVAPSSPRHTGQNQALTAGDHKVPALRGKASRQVSQFERQNERPGVRFRPSSRFDALEPAEVVAKKWEEGQVLPGRPAYPFLWPSLRPEEGRSDLPGGRVDGRGNVKRMNSVNCQKSAAMTSQK